MLIDSQFVQYEYDHPGSVTPGTKINLATEPNTTPNGSYAMRNFMIDCYTPRTWPTGVCQSIARFPPATVLPYGGGE